MLLMNKEKDMMEKIIGKMTEPRKNGTYIVLDKRLTYLIRTYYGQEVSENLIVFIKASFITRN